MTMESRARENQGPGGEAEDASGRAPGDRAVEAGIAVHQNNYAAERESRGKSREKCQIR
jgi:hypothetical protein